jgi:hypothetical protein
MNRMLPKNLITYIGTAAIGVVIVIMIILQLENAKVDKFSDSYVKLFNDSRNLTQDYQGKIAKWQLKQYDNKTMVSITDTYLPKFQELASKVENLNPPERFKKTVEFSVKSIQSEMQSYMHFRNFLITNNPKENETSNALLADALKYETYAFDNFKGTS